MGLISSVSPSSSARYLARVMSKPMNWSWPVLLVSTNSMGAKSGDMATVRVVFSAAFLHPITLSSIAAAKRITIVLFMFVPSVS